MTDEKIEKSLAKGELHLDFWSGLTHYGLVVFFLLIPLVLDFTLLKNTWQGQVASLSVKENFFEMFVPVVLALLAYKFQRRKLKLTPVKTKIQRPDFTRLIEKIAVQEHWTPHFANEKVLIAKSHPGFVSGSWGEQITVFFEKERILINSICDPDKQASVVSFGRNRKNVRLLIEAIKSVERESPIPAVTTTPAP